jgi:dolichol-phosphate mannosyltransferase
MTASLWVIMPVYNEAESISGVVNEWLQTLHTLQTDFVLCVLNDGSRDRTLDILRQLEEQHPALQVVDKPNSGHGQTCVTGYRKAVDAGAQWIFQVDSDGQCDPAWFPAFWEARHQHPVIYGFRKKRDDGFIRFLISRVVTFVTWLGTGGVWVPDANVPYRLMRQDTLTEIARQVPQ